MFGLTAVLLFAVPLVGAVPAGASTPSSGNPLQGQAAPGSVPKNTASSSPTLLGPEIVTLQEVGGYEMVVQPPISTMTDFYGGATIPVKFQLLDENGNIVSDATATLWVNGNAATASGRSDSGNTFRYDPVSAV